MQVRNHIEDDVLLDYAEHRLDAAATERVRAHLASGCRRCMSELAFWQRTLPLVHAAYAPGATESALRRAYALFEPRAKQRAIWGQTVAKLIFDSRMQLAPAGVRDLNLGAFKLVYEVDDAHIDLLCERDSASWSISGQILTESTSDPGWSIAVRTADGERTIDADALGEFRVEGIAPGACDLALQTNSHHISLPTISL